MTGPVLVIGGAGYIGSHAILALKQKGIPSVIFDNYATGNRDIAERLEVPIFDGDAAKLQDLDKAFSTYQPSSVMHFAAFANVGESVAEPRKYYGNNVANTINLLDIMLKYGTKYFIFSSTCATYGTPEGLITEATPQAPINPYGRSKLMVEQILRDYDAAYGLKSVVFRYFNAAGADPSAIVGERHDPETHLIPLAIKASTGGKELSIFGSDYPTPDGTCVRDYIHVTDIAEAHILGLQHLQRGGNSDDFNIGTGSGNSVLEVINAVERLGGRKVPVNRIGRRAGDPPYLVAGSTKLQSTLNWVPKFPKLDQIVETALRWHETDAKR